MTDNEILDLLRSDTALNEARRIFSGAAASIEQAGQQRTPLGPIAQRRMEIEAVKKIAAAFGVSDFPTTAPALQPSVWRRLLDISSAHLSDATRRTMETWTAETAPLSGFAKQFYGWFCWVPGPSLTEPAYASLLDKVPSDLVAVLRFAHQHGAHYVMIDADGSEHPGLRTYADGEPATASAASCTPCQQTT